MKGRVFASFVIVCAALVAAPARLAAQDFSKYRAFHLGNNSGTVMTTLGATVTVVAATTGHDTLRQLEWRPSRWGGGTSLPSTDPVDRILFHFHDDALFRIVVEYRRDSTEGMTNADFIEALSDTYGARALPLSLDGRIPSDSEVAAGILVARWGDARQRVALYRDTWSLRLIISDSEREREAGDARRRSEETPAESVERQKAEREADRATAEKVRTTNKSGFHP